MFSTILIFTAVLSLLVFVHELGHFVVAKRAGVRVDEFGFGFPPRMFGFKRGGTVYSINWIPLGGFVKIKGESGEHKSNHDSFGAKPAWLRTLILAAGVIMNAVLAWALLTVGYGIGLPQVIENLPPQARVAEAKIQVMTVLKGSPADQAGMRAGDELMTIDAAALAEIADIQKYSSEHDGVPVAVKVGRDGRQVELAVVPAPLAETGKVGFGIALVKTGLVSYPWYLAPVQGLSATLSFGREILASFGTLFGELFSAKPVSVDFSGPVGIAVVTAQVVDLGFRYLLQFTALLSVNLAIINVLPLPALDGGRIMFLAVEKIRGRAVSRRVEATAHNIGFALLMLL
ncbi:RIP metalloprotease RseP, partial [Candidatus Uhrbacteria bacterium]|nr:RIP metalloprotease RseP [Candidatus Uhrbacteria bacterium]